MKRRIQYEVEAKDYTGLISLMRRYNEIFNNVEQTEAEKELLDIYTHNIDFATVRKYRKAWSILGDMAEQVENARIMNDDHRNTQLFYLHQSFLCERWKLEEIFRDFETVGVYVD